MSRPGFGALLDELDRLRVELAATVAARGFAMQRLTELKLAHAKECEEYRRRLAIGQANFEWLTVSYNQLQAERTQLLSARTGVSMAPMQIQIAAPPEPRSDGAEQMAERPMRDNRVPGIEDLVAQGLSFEDVGEREARALGLSGEVYDGGQVLVSS